MIRDAMTALMIGVACFLTMGEVSGQKATEPPAAEFPGP